MKLFRFILGKILAGVCVIAAMVLLVGLWELRMLPSNMMLLVATFTTLLVALVIVLTWNGQEKNRLSIRLIISMILLGIGSAAIVLAMQLRKSQLLSENLIVLISVAVALLTVLGVVLNWFSKGKGRMIAGFVLVCISIGALSVGSFYVWKAVNTIDRTLANGSGTVVGVYMRADDKRELEANFQFGIWAPEGGEEDEAVNSVIKKLNKDLETTISCTGYETPIELLDALLNGNLDAIIWGEELLPMFSEEIPGFKEKLDQTRKVFLQVVADDVPEDESGGKDPEYTSLKDSFAVYISGIDARYGGVGVKARSDVNIIAVVNPKTRQVLLVSTPRDYYVPISSSKSYLDGKKDKLTHAGLDGPEASKKTLSNLYGIDISYYFKVNFSGFVNIVDALDGITVYSEFNFGYRDDDGSYYSYQKGDNELNGKEALGFCRNRYSFASGDNQRGKNQMAVIKGVINKALSPKLLTNYTQILDAVSESMEMTVPMDVIGDLVSRQLSDGGEWNVVSYSVTGSGGYAKSPAAGGAEAYMMFPNEESVERAKELIQDVIDGKTVTP